MISIAGRSFKSVWLVDFEFASKNSELPEVRCLVAIDLVTGRRFRLWADEINSLSSPPYEIGADDLFVAYYSVAEMLCHFTLGWKAPFNILDLFTEFRVMTNGKEIPCGNGILGAQAYFGINGIQYSDKETMRTLALRGGEYSEDERKTLVDYCESDVVALDNLIRAMAPSIDLDRALLRGRYMSIVALMEFNGISLDSEMLEHLKSNWDSLKVDLIREINSEFDVFEGLVFKTDKFIAYLNRNHLPWPHHPSGSLDMTDNTFKEMAKVYPQLQPLRELRSTLSQLRLHELTVDKSGRSRCMLSPFRSKTGRNQPSNSKFIFGMPSYMRRLIKPKQDFSQAYLDFSQQEFGIAAALSNDPNMREAYISGDPYLSFAILAGAAPVTATRETHRDIREQYKACVLAVQYGMGVDSLALRIRQHPVYAKLLLAKHKAVFREFWKYSDAVVNFAALEGYLTTALGWKIAVSSDMNERTVRNFLMQANGADILRLSCILAAERGVQICAPVHDAILIEAPSSIIDDHVKIAQDAMSDASEVILGNLRLRTDKKVIRYPERYTDDKGDVMWNRVTRLLNKTSSPNPVPLMLGLMCLLATDMRLLVTPAQYFISILGGSL
jgi:DNA polymerase-1